MRKILGLDDALVFAGLAALLNGVRQWSTPAAWVLFGLSLIAIAVWPSVGRVKR